MTAATVSLRWISLLAEGGELGPDLAVLTPDERARAARFHFPRHRRRFVRARAQLRRQLADVVGGEPGTLDIATHERGKPYLPAAPGLEFNLSHSGERGLIAWSRSAPLGVDLEAVRPVDRLEDLAERNFAAPEFERIRASRGRAQRDLFFRCWTRKEAFVKAVGDGLVIDLRSFVVGLDGGAGPVPLELRAGNEHGGAWTLRALDAGDGWAAALALRAAPAELAIEEIPDRV